MKLGVAKISFKALFKICKSTLLISNKKSFIEWMKKLILLINVSMIEKQKNLNFYLKTFNSNL